MLTYFDLTDLVQYAKGHNRVSGIQRVQWRVLCELAHGPHAHQIRLCFYSSERKQYLSIAAQVVFSEPHAEFHAGQLLQALGEVRPSPLLPPRYEIKRLLKPYDDRKLLRGLIKGQLYLTALLRPQALLARGVEEWRGPPPPPNRTPRPSPLILQAHDQLALLGAYWDHEAVIQRALRHRLAQGNVTMLVHDVIPHAAPALCSDSQVQRFRQHMPLFPKVANRFIAVSHYTAQDFLQAMQGQVSPHQLTVVPLAHAFGHQARRLPPPARSSPSPAGPSQRQVLCVGTIEARKNQVLLLQVWQALIKRWGERNTPELVLCGKYGSKAEAFKALLAKDPQLQRKVRIINAPSDAQLLALYEQAWLTVFPSLYEGWGLPVGEAAWLGKVCLASDAASLPEVLGEAALSLPAQTAAPWVEAISAFIQDPARLGAWQQRVRQAPLRDWPEVAQAMLDAITAGSRRPRQGGRPDMPMVA